MGWVIIDEDGIGRLVVTGKPKARDFEQYDPTAIVSVAKKGTDPALLAEYDVQYFYLPVPDGKTVPIDGFEAARDTVLTLLDFGGSVIVHCLAGRNRSATVAALVVRELYGLSGAEAMAYVRERRPRAIANPVFEEWLGSLPSPGGET